MQIHIKGHNVAFWSSLFGSKAQWYHDICYISVVTSFQGRVEFIPGSFISLSNDLTNHYTYISPLIDQVDSKFPVGLMAEWQFVLPDFTDYH